MRLQKFRGNVFVANLPTGFTDAQLAQAFDAFGMVMGACMARDLKTGTSKGHGLVDLAPKGAAERAVKAMNGAEIGGRRIEARLADPNMALTVPLRIDPRGRNDHRGAMPPRLAGAPPAPVTAPNAPAPRTVTVEIRKSRRIRTPGA